MKDLYSYPEHLSNLFNMLELNRKRLELDMTEGLAAAKGAGFNPEHSKQTQALADAAKKLGQEIRSWLDDLAKMTGNLSQAKRVSLLIDWVQSLPGAVRYDFYDRCMAFENRRTDGGIKITVPVRHKGKRTNRGSKEAGSGGRTEGPRDVDQGVPAREVGGDDSE